MAKWKTITHPLAHPIEVGEGEAKKTISEIVLREPDVEALERIEEVGGLDDRKALPMKAIRVMISALSGIDEDHLKKMHVADFMEVGEAIAPLLESFVAAGSPDAPSIESSPKPPQA